MNEIINSIGVALFFGSLFPLTQSLIKTVTAYKINKKLKNELAKSKNNELDKLEEIIATQKEILEILENKKIIEKSKSLEFEKQKLEKSKKEIESNLLDILQISEEKRA